jgi:hypothetical protein
MASTAGAGSCCSTAQTGPLRAELAMACRTQANENLCGTAGWPRRGRFELGWEAARTCSTFSRKGRGACTGEPTSGFAILTISLHFAVVADRAGAGAAPRADRCALGNSPPEGEYSGDTRSSRRPGPPANHCTTSRRFGALARPTTFFGIGTGMPGLFTLTEPKVLGGGWWPTVRPPGEDRLRDRAVDALGAVDHLGERRRCLSRRILR